MRPLILIATFALLSCGQNSHPEKEPSNQNDSTKKAMSPVLITTPPADEALVNKLLLARPGYKWHVVTDKEAKWQKKDYDYYLTKGRIKDPNYPFIY